MVCELHLNKTTTAIKTKADSLVAREVFSSNSHFRGNTALRVGLNTTTRIYPARSRLWEMLQDT